MYHWNHCDHGQKNICLSTFLGLQPLRSSRQQPVPALSPPSRWPGPRSKLKRPSQPSTASSSSAPTSSQAPSIALSPSGTPTDGCLVRLHYECVTGKVFGSQKCEDGTQLDSALDTIVQKRGVLIDMHGLKGRGVGLPNKFRALGLPVWKHSMRLPPGNPGLISVDDTLQYSPLAPDRPPDTPPKEGINDSIRAHWSSDHTASRAM